MKDILKISGLFLLILIIQSCKKDEDNFLTDVDGNAYTSIKIGDQVWMVENLKTTRYRNGDTIPNESDSTLWINFITGVYCNYNNENKNSNTYGRLYNWYAVNDSREIAPKGWHIATKTEWITLMTYLGGEAVAGGKMKEIGTMHWNNPNIGADNSSSFSGLPGGFLSSFGIFLSISEQGYWWTATENSDIYAWGSMLDYRSASLTMEPGYKYLGLSVRCVKDN